MVIHESGNGGIGIASPNNKLDVDGTVRASGATTLESTLSVGGTTTLGQQLHVKGNDICLGPNAQGGQARALVCSTSGNGKLIINYDGDFPDGVLIESYTKILGNLEVTGSLSGSAFDSLGASAFNHITESGSNVGIGTTSPTKKLHVKGNFFVENPTRAGKGMLHSHTTNDSNTSNGCTFLDVGFQEAQNPNETPGTGPVTAIRLGGRNGDGPFNH